MKRIIAILFAGLLLISNVGLTYAVHYCGGKVAKKQLSIVVDSRLDCGMADSDQACINHTADNNVSNHCCSNEVIHLSVDTDFESPLVREQKNTETSFTIFRPFYITKSNTFTSTDAYSTYHPPTLDLDIPVMIQCFLI